MNNAFSYSIENLRMWCGGSWAKYELQTTNPHLRIHYDQLLITTESHILESLNFNAKIKGFFKDDVVIIIISSNNQEVRKIKFKIREGVHQCLHNLNCRFPVVSYGSVASKNKMMTKYRNVNDILKNSLEGKVKFNIPEIPSEHKNFIKLCLLDPIFPQLVKETEKIIKEEILDKN